MNARELAGKKVTVVGLAATGLSLARFLAAAGAHVTVSEARAADRITVAPDALPPGTVLELGGHRLESVTTADLVVPSPGVPRDMPILRDAAYRGIPVWSEIELASRLIGKPMLAVTGTNGKTTTVSLLGAMLAEGGYRAPVVGNIGPPLIGMAGADDTFDCLVVEISSFQLEWVYTFRPRVAAVLNITDDHLDRYRDTEDYLETKMRIAAFQGPEDAIILNADDPALRGREQGLPARVIWFSHGSRKRGVWREGSLILADLAGTGTPLPVLDTRELKLVGIHNVENVMAAAAMALDFGAPPEAVRRAAAAFTSLPHRNELVAEVNGVRWFDDSKGTNVGAVVKSLESFPGPVILIAGGREKGGSYAPLAAEVKRTVKLLVLIGEARERMKAELGPLTETVEAGSLEEAVRIAAGRGLPGDTVLLSPACSSFDMFRDYHHRGEVFRAAVRSLPCRAS
jgi:UDP-N-acetylmuramoylalanine--D-glutamate ligase